MAEKDARRRFHDRIAPRYDQIYDSPYWRLYREVSWRHLARFLPRERPAWALDLGCGTGWFGLRLLKAGFHVTFLDLSQGMLDQAREAVAALRRPEEARFLRADMQDLRELEAGSFAFATAEGDALGFCRSPGRALKELARVLRPGGRAVLSVDHRAAGARSFVEEGDLEGLDKFIRTGNTEWLARRLSERFPVHMFEAEELRALLENAGYRVLDLVGKTVLFGREDAGLMEEAPLRRLAGLEERVHGRPGWLALASHLQVAAELGA